jgi:flagellar FliL protein
VAKSTNATPFHRVKLLCSNALEHHLPAPARWPGCGTRHAFRPGASAAAGLTVKRKRMSEQEERKPEATAPEAPKTVKKPLLVGVVAGAFIAGSAVGLFLVGPMVSGPAAPPADAAESDAKGGEHGGEAAAGAGTLYLIDNMVLNPAGSNGSRFLLVATSVEVSDAAIVEELRGRDAEARDVLSGVLGARTVEELSDLTRRDSLRSEIARALNHMVKRPQAVRRVHFPQFVVQ